MAYTLQQLDKPRAILRRDGILKVDPNRSEGALYADLRQLPQILRSRAHGSTWRLRRHALKQAAIEFHSRFGLPLPAEEKLKRDFPIFRVTHQPNLLAGLNVTGTVLLLRSAALTNDIVVYTFVDYDVAGDRRFRTSHLPMGLYQTCSLSAGVPRAFGEKLSCILPSPTLDQVAKWICLLHQSTKSTERDLRKQGFDTRSPRETVELLGELEGNWRTYARTAQSLSDYNAAA